MQFSDLWHKKIYNKNLNQSYGDDFNSKSLDQFYFQWLFYINWGWTCAVTFKTQANIISPDITWEMAILWH